MVKKTREASPHRKINVRCQDSHTDSLIRKDSKLRLPWNGTGLGCGGVAESLVEPPATRTWAARPLPVSEHHGGLPVRCSVLLDTNGSLAPILETRDSLYFEEFVVSWRKR